MITFIMVLCIYMLVGYAASVATCLLDKQFKELWLERDGIPNTEFTMWFVGYLVVWPAILGPYWKEGKY